MATASADTLDVDPDGVIPMEAVRRAYQTEHGSGAVHARLANSAASKNTLKRETRVWTLSYNYRSAAEATALRAIWANSLGGSKLLDWTPPDEVSAIQVRLLGGSWRERYDGSLYFLTLRVEEVL